MNFEYEIENKETAIVVVFKGNLIEKGQAVPMLEEIDNYISEKGINRLILDMTDMMFMNSTGLNVLIGILTKARTVGGEAVICCLPPKINELLVITKLNAVFTVKETVDEALQVLA